MPEKVLVIGSHFDDIEIGCGGTLLHYRDAGARIVMVILKPNEWRSGARIMREKEQVAAAEMLTAKAIRLHEDTLIEDAIALCDNEMPSVLLFPYEQDTHQDHNVASQVGFAVSRHTQSTVLRYLTPTSHSYYPNFISVIDFEAKKKLVSLFSSQMERRPKFMEIMEAQNKFFGSLIPGDGHYTEGFCLHRMVIGLDQNKPKTEGGINQ